MVDAGESGVLGSNGLVLNRGYCAIQVVGLRRALRLLCCDVAEVIHFEEDQFSNHDFESWREISRLLSRETSALCNGHEWIRAVNFVLLVPRVIRLLSFERIPRNTVHLNRRAILSRDEHTCQYCGHRLPTPQLSLDHVVPRSRGGRTTWENVVCACIKCNVRKGARTPSEAGMKLIQKPHRPSKSPFLAAKLENPRYESWRVWVARLSHNVDVVAR